MNKISLNLSDIERLPPAQAVVRLADTCIALANKLNEVIEEVERLKKQR